MKQPLLYFCAIALTICFHSSAQNVPKPDFEYKIMGVKDDTTLFPLDKTMLAAKDNGHSLLGSVNAARALAGKTKVYYIADGDNASVVVSGKKTDKYVISIPPTVDPEDIIELFQFEIHKHDRRFDFAHITLGNTANHSNVAEDASIPIVLKKQSDGVYIITTKENLPAGEYFFKINGSKATGKMADQANGKTLTAFCISVKG